MLTLTVAAWAQDDDDKPIPLTPQDKSMQLWTFGAIVAVVVVFGLWYLWRVRSITRASSPQAPPDGD